MTFQSAPNMAQAIIKGTCHGVPVANVLNFRFSGAYGAADIAELALIVDTNTGSLYKGLIDDGCSYDGVLVRGLTSSTDFEASSVVDAGPGTLTTDGLPNNVAMCLTLRTANTGRSARGRFYGWPTVQANLATSQQFSTTYGAALVAAVEASRGSAPGAGWTMVVLSRRNAKALREEAVGYPVLEVSIRNYTVDSQRGRLPAGH